MVSSERSVTLEVLQRGDNDRSTAIGAVKRKGRRKENIRGRKKNGYLNPIVTVRGND